MNIERNSLLRCCNKSKSIKVRNIIDITLVLIPIYMEILVKSIHVQIQELVLLTLNGYIVDKLNDNYTKIYNISFYFF